jgi:predicted nucleotidyltransferase
VPRGYEEGPVAEEAQARIDALERGEPLTTRPSSAGRTGVYGSTEDDPELHFLGWASEVDADALFESGQAWGISLRRIPD